MNNRQINVKTETLEANREIVIDVSFMDGKYALTVSPQTKTPTGFTSVLGASKYQLLESVKRFSRARLEQLAAIYTPNHPDVERLRQNVIDEGQWAD